MKTLIISSIIAATLALALIGCEKKDDSMVKSDGVVFKANNEPTKPVMRTFYINDKRCWCAPPAGNCLPEVEVIGTITSTSVAVAGIWFK